MGVAARGGVGQGAAGRGEREEVVRHDRGADLGRGAAALVVAVDDLLRAGAGNAPPGDLVDDTVERVRIEPVEVVRHPPAHVVTRHAQQHVDVTVCARGEDVHRVGVHHRAGLPGVQDDAGGLVVHPAADSEVRRTALRRAATMEVASRSISLSGLSATPSSVTNRCASSSAHQAGTERAGPPENPASRRYRPSAEEAPSSPKVAVGAAAVAVDGDVVGVAAEVGDVPLDPGERGDDVLEEEVAGLGELPAVLRERERTQRAEPVVDRHAHHAPRRGETGGVRGDLGVRAVLESAAVDVHGHRERLVGRLLGGPHVQVQAVLAHPAVRFEPVAAVGLDRDDALPVVREIRIEVRDHGAAVPLGGGVRDPPPGPHPWCSRSLGHGLGHGVRFLPERFGCFARCVGG